MNIGYLVYRRNFYISEQKRGSDIHSYQVTSNLMNMGIKIHMFNDKNSGQFNIYPCDSRSISDFITKIDLLYTRIDGHLLHRNGLFLECMDRAIAMSLPMVWEVHAPAEEVFITKGRFKFLYKYISDKYRFNLRYDINKIFYKRLVEKEERCRRYYAEFVKAGICKSNALKQYVQSDLGIKSCKVIPNGSDPCLFSPEKNKPDLYKNHKHYFKIIWAGTGYSWQSPDLIRKLSKVARQRGDKILFILLDNLPNSVNKIKPAANLLIFNQVSYNEVPNYIASADACLCIYDDFSRFKYDFYMSPIKIFDYMLSAKPVVATRTGQISEIISDREDGLLTANTVEDIYEKILLLRNDKERACAMGASARSKVSQKYTWEIAAKSVNDVLRSVLDHEMVV
ncbi:glycosyltransferase family 4 protein [Elusimicrobiota bacterium]